MSVIYVVFEGDMVHAFTSVADAMSMALENNLDVFNVSMLSIGKISSVVMSLDQLVMRCMGETLKRRPNTWKSCESEMVVSFNGTHLVYGGDSIDDAVEALLDSHDRVYESIQAGSMDNGQAGKLFYRSGIAIISRDYTGPASRTLLNLYTREWLRRTGSW